MVIRVATADDAAVVAALRSQWHGAGDPGFAERVSAWLESEGDRRTTWLAIDAEQPAGMASLYEYRRMPSPGRPDSRWGYVGNVFVREELRGRGIGSELMRTLLDEADQRAYARLVVSPGDDAIGFFRRAGFKEAADPHLLLVRHGS